MNRVIHKCSKNFILDLSYIYLIISQAGTDGEKNGPKFVEPIPNVTVSIGRDASLPCVVSNLGTYKVVWIHIDRQMVITRHTHVITRIPRYSISPINKTTWVLHVTRVQQEDRGYYMCQVNTNPVMSQVGYLQVTVPPVFVEDGSTSTTTVVVRENQNLTLSCKAQGFPQPKIAWKREDDRDIVLSRRYRGPVFSGETIHFERISRSDMAGYLCIAANGVPPSLIKRIFINVEFSPIILLTNQLIASSIGSTVTLECHAEANPSAETYWMRNGVLLYSNEKYHIVISQNSYTTSIKLTIHNVSRSDFADYKCLSKNLLGETEGTLIFHEYPTSKTSEFVLPSTTPVMLSHHNDMSVRKPTDEEMWKNEAFEEKPVKLNSSSTYNRGFFIPDIHVHPKTLFKDLGCKFPIPPCFVLLVVVIFLYSL